MRIMIMRVAKADHRLYFHCHLQHPLHPCPPSHQEPQCQSLKFFVKLWQQWFSNWQNLTSWQGKDSSQTGYPHLDWNLFLMPFLLSSWICTSWPFSNYPSSPFSFRLSSVVTSHWAIKPSKSSQKYYTVVIVPVLCRAAALSSNSAP